MAAFNKINAFVADIANGIHNLGSNSLYVCLTNVAPVASNTVFANLTEIAAGNGYTTGGNVASLTSSTQSSGLYKLVLANPATWTATGGSIGPFRYVVLYNNTAASKNLIGWWDYGSSITLATGETFTVTFDATNGVLQLQ